MSSVRVRTEPRSCSGVSLPDDHVLAFRMHLPLHPEDSAAAWCSFPLSDSHARSLESFYQRPKDGLSHLSLTRGTKLTKRKDGVSDAPRRKSESG